MAFVKKTWKDRIVQFANRRLLTKSGGEVEQVTVTRDEGTISEAGDQFNASNMNDLEQRVKDGFDEKADQSTTYTKTEVDNKFKETKEWKTSTTSFVDACSKIGVYNGIGNVLDNLKTNISSYTGNSINTKVDSTQGPVYFVWFGKASDQYFTGILLTYFGNSETTRKAVYFSYFSGTYQVRLL